MISKNLLKEVLASNERFILDAAGGIIGREGLRLPERLRKTVVFHGVRRSGKTFILFDLFRKNRDGALYADFEDDRLSGFEGSDFERLKDAFLELKPELAGRDWVLLLDEVQTVEGWEHFCRRAAERENARVFVSGSSSKIMPSEIGTELRGRSWSLEVLPFSFREYLAAKGVSPDDKGAAYGPRRALTKRLFLEYLRWGGFPEACALASEQERTKLLREYLGAMFFRDLVERYAVTNVPLLDALSDKLFSSFSQKLSLTAVYRQYKGRLPLSKDLLFRYHKHFLESMLIYEVRIFSESAYVRTRNPAKVYLADTGLARREAGADSGRLLENMVYLELRRRGWELSYFEGKRECDFIAKREGAILPIQAAFELNDANRDREVGGLLEACKRARARDGLILTYDDEEEFRLDGIAVEVRPAWRWSILREGQEPSRRTPGGRPARRA